MLKALTRFYMYPLRRKAAAACTLAGLLCFGVDTDVEIAAVARRNGRQFAGMLTMTPDLID